MTGAMGTTAGNDVYLLQYDDTGTVRSSRRFGDDGHPEAIDDAASDPSGGMFVIGSGSAKLVGATGDGLASFLFRVEE